MSQAGEVVGLLRRRALCWYTVLEQVVLNGRAGGGGTRGDVELAIKGGGMAVDGARTDHQVLGDLRVGPPLSYQAQHRDLASRQASRKDDGLLSWCSR